MSNFKNSSFQGLRTLSQQPWKSIENVCKDAAVFLDNSCAELLHWAGGVELLGGSVGIYDLYGELSPITKDFIASAPYCHVVVIVGSFLHGSTSQHISTLLSDLQPLECHLYCSQSEEMHAQLLPVSDDVSVGGGEDRQDHGLGDYSHFGEFQALMRKWINREVGVKVSVQHLPLFHAEICPGLVTTPPYSSLFPLLPPSIVDIQAQLLNEGETDCSIENLTQVDFHMLSRTHQMTLKSFACGLNSLMEEWGMSEDIFSLGTTSRFIANQLATLPAARARRKTMTSKCSILLIDRSLDVTGPSLHSTGSLADRILSLLPHSSPLSCDVSVDMSVLGFSPQRSHDQPVTTSLPRVSGRLGHPTHPRARQLLKTLICSKQKEALMEVSRCLLESVSEEGLSVKMSGRLGRPSATQLKTFIQHFKDHPRACASQHAVLELACAVVQALQGDVDQKWEGLASMEKVLSMSIQDQDSPSMAAQLTDQAVQMASNIAQRTAPISLSELLGVAVAMYSWMGRGRAMGTAKEEEGLKEALATLALSWRPCDVDFLRRMRIAQSDTRSRVLGRMSLVMDSLVSLGETRDQLSQFKQTLVSEDSSYLPLLSQVVLSIFDPAHPELMDVVHHSQGTVGSILKSSLSLFVSSSKPRPHQHPVLLLFVVGGMSCSEVRQIRELVNSSKTDVEVVIGTTRLTTPSDITDQVLGCSTNS